MNLRQEQILNSLKKLNYLNRQQIERLHNLRSKGNTNRVLRDLAPFLSSYREGYETIYYLNKAGREWVGSEKVRKKTPQTAHFIARNDFYLFMGCPQGWENEVKLGGEIVADAIFRTGGKWAVLEVDVNAQMIANKRKIEKYKKLYSSGMFQRHKDFGYFPTLFWVTQTDHRANKLAQLCNGLPHKIFTMNDIK